MIDIHHHCLPGVDDGPRELAEAVDLCHAAREEGVETIVATPHVLRGRWRTFTPAELKHKLDALRDAVGAAPNLILGSEYFFGHDMAEVLKAGDRVVPLANGRYVLVEFTANAVPPLIEQPFYRLQLEGWVPIIAHPERNLVFQSNPQLLAKLIEHGARTQITAASLLGDFGIEAQRVSEAWLGQGLVHLVASDAHNLTKRPPRVRAALEVLRQIAGEHVAEALTRTNPLAVVENRALPYDPEPRPTVEKSGFFRRLGRFFGAQ